jgi:hypothetical protein
MITLTNPIKVPNSIGGTTTLSYDILNIIGVVSDPVSQSISATVQITSSANANATPIKGSLSLITQGSPSGMLSIPNLGIYIAVAGIPAAVSTIQGWITTMQTNLESGLISVGAITGSQTPGYNVI